MRSSLVLPALLLSAVVLTACGSSGEPVAAESATSPSASVGRPSTSPSPSASATRKADGLALGETAHIKLDDGHQEPFKVSVTALSFKAHVTADQLPHEQGIGSKSDIWAALEMKVCLDAGSQVSTTSTPWQLALPDGTRIESSAIPVPGGPGGQLPFESRLTAGDCVRGKILFPVPKNVRPTYAVYAPPAIDHPEKWTLDAKAASNEAST